MSKSALPLSSCFPNRLLPAAAAAIWAALGLTACGPAPETESARLPASATLCSSEYTPIQDIQGTQYQSPIKGQEVTARGTVTRVEGGAGFYIESDSGNRSGKASRALFVADPELALQATPGQIMAVTGIVDELGSARDTLTALTGIRDWGACGQAADLPLTEAKLPLRPRRREALEGMRIQNSQDLVVTDVYRLHEGRVRLSLEEPLRVPTDIVEPGRSSARQFSRNLERSFDVVIRDVSAVVPVVGGAGGPVTGVLGHDGRYPLLHADEFEISAVEPPAVPAHPGGPALRVVNANLQNFFNGNGDGSGFPAERGPETFDAFQQKSARIQAALAQLQPDLLAVQELENDGYAENSAATDLLRLLRHASGVDWKVVTPAEGRVGTDVISVGIFYRPDKLSAVGPSQTLDSAPFRGLSRQPLAQVFSDRTTDVRFGVVVNHLKSKGSCPDDGPDASQKDGQGCWNQARVAAVESLLPWLEQAAADSATPGWLILGDMNSWRREDPMDAFHAGGLIDLVLQAQGRSSYSYVYRGERGTLDYALATATLQDKVIGATIWNINSPWPSRLDLQPAWLRYADHDPVVVDLDFSQ